MEVDELNLNSPLLLDVVRCRIKDLSSLIGDLGDF